ncbi:MAG: hypothetical protein WDO24_23070 [Pseudomonadota bacterium]
MVLLVAACILPLLALGFCLQYLEYRNDVADTGRQTLDLARSMARQVDQELQRRVTALQVLAQSKTLQLDDLAAFRARAAALADSLFPGENVVLLSADGQLLASTQGVPGRAAAHSAGHGNDPRGCSRPAVPASRISSMAW